MKIFSKFEKTPIENRKRKSYFEVRGTFYFMFDKIIIKLGKF